MNENKIYYFDNNATGRVSKEVIDYIVPFLYKEYNPSSTYSPSREIRELIEKVRYDVAEYLHCDKNGIYFIGSGSESNNMIIKGISYANKSKGNHIITTRIEHPSVLETCKFLEKNGFEVTYLDVDSEGIINLDELKESIKRNTILVSIMYANSEIGTIQPIKEIGDICKENNIVLHTDITQAISTEEINIEELNIDCITFSGHKIHTPKGIGVAYINPNIEFESLIHGGSQERHKRAGTENVLGILALGKAIEILKRDRESNNEKLKELQGYLIAKLLDIPEIRINGSLDNRILNNINVSLKGVDGESLLFALDLEGICVSSSSACHGGSTEPSYVLSSIGVPEDYINGTLRISYSSEDTKEDLDYLIKMIKEKVIFLRELMG